jgi:hypothetical protein
MGLGRLGIARNSQPKMLNSLGQLALSLKGDAQIVVRLRLIRTETERFFQMGNGLRDPSSVQVSRGEEVMLLSIFGSGLDQPLAVDDGKVQLALLESPFQGGQVGSVARKHLEPQISHLIR